MEQFFSFVDKYSIMLGNNPIHPMVFLVIAIILILLFIIKGNIVFFTRKKESKEKGIYKEFIAYIFGNEGLSFLFSFLVSLFIVIVSGNNVDNDSLNFFISPLIGFLSSLWFENQMEKNNILKNPLNIVKKDGGSSDQENPNPVSIIINNEPGSMYDEPAPPHQITKEELEEKGVLYFVNQLNNNQMNLEKELNKNSDEMQKQSEILEALRQERIEEKGLELEELIYSCLNKGSVTPEEDKLIRRKYHIYHEVLGGNHGIQELYEERYMNLKVHM